jgi:hypothetical protein
MAGTTIVAFLGKVLYWLCMAVSFVIMGAVASAGDSPVNYLLIVCAIFFFLVGWVVKSILVDRT